MKTIDNIEQILKRTPFRNDLFYYIQVMARKKDNLNLTRDTQLLSKCITSKEVFDLYLPEIKSLCETFGARCYISLWPRSIEKFAKELSLRMAARVCNNSFSFKVFREMDSIAMSKHIIQWKGVLPESICMLDVDTLEGDALKSLEDFLMSGGIKIVDVIPSVHGKHYICSNFYPLKIGATKVDNAENWRFDHEGRTFTICRDMSVILYACIKEESD